MCELRNNRTTLHESVNRVTSRPGNRNTTRAMISGNVAFIVFTLPYTITLILTRFLYESYLLNNLRLEHFLILLRRSTLV